MADIIEKRNQIISQLISARLSQNISQSELATRLGTNRSNICRLETAKYSPSIDFLIKAADALGLDFDVMLRERSEEMSDVYELRLYDETLMIFSLFEKGLEGLVSEILYVNEEKKHLLPIDMEISDDGIIKWLKRRVIPKNRRFVDEILKTLGLSANDTKGIIDVCKGLSLNDSFWVVPKDFNGKFKDYNLYENRFSEILSLVAYTGTGHSHKAFTTSPELTTNGMLPKAWRFIENDGIYLYKGGTDGAANTGNEPYSEYYASQIAEAMGLDSVKYELENWKGILASKCKLFTDIDTAFVPVGRIVTDGGIAVCLKYYKELGEVFYEHLKSMLVFDAVIYNEDRHFGNFGVLRNNHTGEVFAPAPVFDNGLSLFNFAMPEDFNNLEEYASTRTTPYGVSFEAICSEVIGKKQLMQLRKLIGFKFKRHKTINLPEERLLAIEQHIQKRVTQLMNLPNY